MNEIISRLCKAIELEPDPMIRASMTAVLRQTLSKMYRLTQKEESR